MHEHLHTIFVYQWKLKLEASEIVYKKGKALSDLLNHINIMISILQDVDNHYCANFNFAESGAH